MSAKRADKITTSRSPYGERGLKFVDTDNEAEAEVVARSKGRVD